jgi:hypothetical protein
VAFPNIASKVDDRHHSRNALFYAFVSLHSQS